MDFYQYLYVYSEPEPVPVAEPEPISVEQPAPTPDPIQVGLPTEVPSGEEELSKKESLHESVAGNEEPIQPAGSTPEAAPVSVATAQPNAHALNTQIATSDKPLAMSATVLGASEQKGPGANGQIRIADSSLLTKPVESSQSKPWPWIAAGCLAALTVWKITWYVRQRNY